MSDLILSNAVLTNARGIPQAPSDIVASLKRIDDRLDLMHLRPSEVEYESNPNARGTWAIIIEWLQNDPRRARIQSGELDPTAAFDYITALPFDCPIDQARAFFEKAMKGATYMPEARTLLNRMSEWNAQAAAKQAEPFMDAVGEAFDSMKSNPEFAAALGGGTVVKSPVAIDIKSDPSVPPGTIEVRKTNFVERMLEGKRRKAAAKAGQ